jgi:hypothetical protein
MKTIRILFLLMLSTLSAHAFAGENSKISLFDGSVIYGQIKSFADGVYTVETAAFGTIKIRESDIQQIGLRSNAIKDKENVNPMSPLARSELLVLQDRMRGDPEIMNLVLALQSDPDFQEIFKDPDILEALETGDIALLLSNPKFLKLLNSRRIQDIQRRIVD